MMRPLVFAIVVLVALHSPVQVNAEKFAAEFLRLGVGARALGMGDAFLAVATDASAPYWNPALTPSVEAPVVQAMHSERFRGIVKYDAVSGVLPSERVPGSRRDALGVTFLRLGIDDIPVTTNLLFDDFGIDQIEGTADEGEGNGEYDPGERVLVDADRIEYRSDAEYALMLAYGRRFERWSVGLAPKVIYQNAAGNTAFGIGLDLATALHVSPRTTVALKLSDATRTLVSWRDARREWIEPALRFGVAHELQNLPIPGELLLATDLQAFFEDRGEADQLHSGRVSADVHVGGEYGFRDLFALRAGAQRTDWTVGAGFVVSRLAVDYAYLTHDVLGNSHRVSAAWRLSAERSE